MSETGPRGPRGEQGSTGAAGPRGEPGPTGSAAEDPYEDHLTRIEDLLISIRVYVIAFLVMMLIFGLAYTVFLFYAMVIRPSSGGAR